jgi:hypothetical protein
MLLGAAFAVQQLQVRIEPERFAKRVRDLLTVVLAHPIQKELAGAFDRYPV